LPRPANESELKTWRKFREHSRKRLVPGAVFGILGTLLTGAIRLLLGESFPDWLLIVAIGLSWFQFVGDWVNVRSLDRRIADAENDPNS
jgi:hypothetical protein